MLLKIVKCNSIVLFICCILPANSLGQNTDFSTSSGGTNYAQIEFSVGEIFIQETYFKIDVEEESIEDRPYVYPNPASEFLLIESVNPIDLSSLTIIDIQGRVFSNIAVVDGKIHIENLSAGMYYLVSTISEFTPIKFIKR